MKQKFWEVSYPLHREIGYFPTYKSALTYAVYLKDKEPHTEVSIVRWEWGEKEPIPTKKEVFQKQ
jgi:hypothetical protein